MKKNLKVHILTILCLPVWTIQAHKSNRPYPIGFSISETKMVSKIPDKNKDFAFIIPGNLSTYIYNEEIDYYKDYQRSYFAITCKKGGWDCLRHYEILANGCIPYFLDLDKCPLMTMHKLPKSLIKEAMSLPGVSRGKIDHSKFNYGRYYDILNKLLDHTKKYLTTRSMAQYLLDTVGYSGNGSILFLSNDPNPDYIKTCLLIGLKELFQEKVIDFPKLDHIYKNYPGDTKRLYGKGFSYTKIVPDIPVNRSNLENRVKNKEFELIIYAHIHCGRLFYNTVLQNYPTEKIIYICGEDSHKCPYTNLPNLFLREYYTNSRENLRGILTWSHFKPLIESILL